VEDTLPILFTLEKEAQGLRPFSRSLFEKHFPIACGIRIELGYCAAQQLSDWLWA